MSQKYIWTNHARKRLKDRKISQTLVANTLSHPHKKLNRKDGGIEYSKVIDAKTITVVVKKNYKNELIIISCWANPPFPGTKDFRQRKRYFQMRDSHGFKKLWMYILYKIGI